ncbi:cytidine deaminase [Flavobacterium sp.]|uniref:cytidine deaminase n=1 Tax=Flavobacterium sp. TaxID=239 RepID=UPI003C39DA1A
MKELTIISLFTVYNNTTELPIEIQNLLIKAIKIRQSAYAPYSQFKVGVAILLANGEIILGANQENAAYPSGLCAERVAIYQAGTLYPNILIKKIIISASSDIKQTTTPIPPCGACRQAIAEYEIKQEQPIEIYFTGESGDIYKSPSLKNLLPLLFNKNLL